MKKKLFLLLSTLVVNTSVAFAVQIGDLYYSLDNTAKTATVKYKSLTGSVYNEGWDITTANIPSVVVYNDEEYRVTCIGQAAFFDCHNLNSVTIPNSVTKIEGYAFGKCTSLASVVIGDSVKSIGDFAFRGCSSLLSLTIPGSVQSIGTSVFSYCSSLTSIAVDANNKTYDSRNNCNAIIETKTNTLIVGCQNTIIPHDITIIGEGAFLDRIGLTSIVIPKSVISIRKIAFAHCSNLSSIVIANDHTEFEDNVFYGCNSLPVVDNIRYADKYLVRAVDRSLSTYTIREGTTWIGDSAFLNCSHMSSIRIPKNVIGVGDYAFSGCYGLPYIDKVRYADTYLVECTGKYTEYTIREGTKWIGDKAFYKRNVVSITIPDGVKTIGKYAFYECANLANVTLPNSVTYIKQYAFGDCKSLTSIILPDSLIRIGENCFDLSQLEYVEIPNSVKIIEAQAFWQCRALDSVLIGENVESIGSEAFALCDYMKSVTMKPTTPPTLHGATFPLNNKPTIYVPCGTVNTYKNAARWKTYSSKIKNRPSPFGINAIAENGTVSIPQYSICDDSIEIVAVPDYGYHFVQWSDGNTDNPRMIVLTKDTTFIAEFTKNKYLVQFFGFNNVLLDSQSIEHGTAATAPEAPKVDHYDFVGWDKEFSNITSNLDVFAIYQQNTEGIEDVNIDTLPQKVVIDGQIYILRGEKVYTVTGQEVK